MTGTGHVQNRNGLIYGISSLFYYLNDNRGGRHKQTISYELHSGSCFPRT